MNYNYILKRPIVSEKTNLLKEKELKYTFLVSLDASKDQIKKAIEEAILDGVIPNEYDAAYKFMMEMKTT